MPEYFDKLHERGMKTVMIIDPAVVVDEKDYWPYEDGKAADVFIKWPANKSPDYNYTESDIMIGYV